MKRTGVAVLFSVVLAFASGRAEAREFSAWGPNDRASGLVNPLRYMSLQSMQEAGLTSAALDRQPWSGSYWLLVFGELAQRYGDPAFPFSSDWKINSAYILKSLGEGPVDQLSPAEKYDLLVGDPGFSLTRSMLSRVRAIYEKTGSVAPWMGLCHGWAPASFLVPRPIHPVTLLAADGRTPIVFYPDDIKGLASLLWSDPSIQDHEIGGRCEEKRPTTDSSGRTISPDCLDTNPGTWHLAIVNEIGAAHKSFIMDADAASEVWNQPVFSYSYTYFNPKTGLKTADLEQARVLRSQFPDDPRASYRGPHAKSVVGVQMRVTYAAETWPLQALKDDPSFDVLRTTQYRYDLELDSIGRIVGGEWHSPDHPDFLWRPESGNFPETTGDIELNRSQDAPSWNGTGSPPSEWQIAARSSSLAGLPLAHVVYLLVTLSRSSGSSASRLLGRFPGKLWGLKPKVSVRPAKAGRLETSALKSITQRLPKQSLLHGKPRPTKR